MSETTRRDLYQWWRLQHSFVYWWLNPFKSKMFNDFNDNFQKALSLSYDNVQLSDFFSIEIPPMNSLEDLKHLLSNLTKVAQSTLNAQLSEVWRCMFIRDEHGAYSHRTFGNYKKIQNSLRSLVKNGYALDKVFHLYCLLAELIYQEESHCEEMIMDMSIRKGKLHQRITDNHYFRLLLNPGVAGLPGSNECMVNYFSHPGELSTALDQVVGRHRKILDCAIEQCQKLKIKFSKDKITLVQKLSAIRKDWRHQSYRSFFKRTSETRELDHALDTLIQTLTKSAIQQSEFNLSNEIAIVLEKINDWTGKRKKKTGFFDINFFSCFLSNGEKTSCRYDDVLTLKKELLKLKPKSF